MISEQLVSLLYGSIVAEVISTSEHITEVNDRLEKIGENIGVKIVDDFLKDWKEKPCTKIVELVDRFCSVGIKKYVGPFESRAEDYKLTEKGFSFNLKINGNPLLKNLEVPLELKNDNLQYQSILKGAIKGAFKVLKFKVQIILIYENLKIAKNESIFFVEATRL